MMCNYFSINTLVTIIFIMLLQSCSTLVKDGPEILQSKSTHTADAKIAVNAVSTEEKVKEHTPAQQKQKILSLPEKAKSPVITLADTSPTTPTATDIEQPKVYDDLWLKTVDHYQLSEHYHPRLEPYFKHYENNLDRMGHVFKRTERYYYFVLQRLLEEGLPAELALLPMIESHYNTFGYSQSQAAGAWQFIPSTGSLFGLKRTWWYDGRRDIVASTNAAIKYLKQLNKTFNGDWLVTLAAYNAGPGTLQRAIRRNTKKGLPTDYWSLTLPKETMHYVPKLLGITRVIEKHAGTSQLKKIDNQPYFEIIETDSQLDLAVAAEMASIDIDLMYQLNSGFSQWATDPKGPHYLIIPTDKSAAFRKALNEKPVEERIVWERYTIKPGDNLLSIAKKHNLSVNVIKSINGLTSNTIYAGKHLLIPIASEQAITFSISSNDTAKRLRSLPNAVDRTIVHRVKAGESLWLIAKKYQVRVKEILRWNKLHSNTLLQIGQKLTINL